MKKLVNYKLKHQFLLYSIFPLALLLILQLLYTTNMADQTEQITKQYFESQIETLSLSFEAEINNIKKAGEALAFNSSITDLIKYEILKDFFSQYHAMKYIDEIVTSVKKFNSSIDNIILVKDHYTFQSIFGGITSGEQIKAVMHIYDLFFELESESSFFMFHKSEHNQNMFLYIQPVFYRDTELSGYSKSAYLLIFICDITKIASFTPDMDKDVIYSIKDSLNNYLIYGSNAIVSQTEYDVMTHQYKNSIVRNVPNTDFYVHCFINAKVSDFKFNTISYFFTVSVLFMLICMIIMSILWNRNIISPIKQISDQITKRSTLYSKNFSFHGPDNEIGVISERLNDMIKSNKAMTSKMIKTQSQLYEVELIKQHSDFSALQSQINPHFLYNTMASIKGLAHIHHVESIAVLCQAISNILRYSIKGNDIVTLNDELSIIKQYIVIMSTRFEERFSIKYNIQEDLLDTQVLKMTLQPLVENSIYHGFADYDSGGRVEIDAVSEDEFVVLSVYDNGSGIPADRLKQINSELENDQNMLPSQSTSGIGIVNIHKRIKLLMGDKYGLTIHAASPGTIVKIRLPLQ